MARRKKQSDYKMFDENGIHKVTGTRYDENGYDITGVNVDGFDLFSRHLSTGKKRDASGYDENGVDKYGNSKY